MRVVIEAHHDHNVLCTLKHFPGHGNSRADSHLGFVDVTETWQPEELLPYANLIHNGLADAIMTAHIYNARLDAIYPATLSGPIIGGILRHRLGYDGVVISDDMQMRAISKQFDFETAVGLAVIAGVDILAISNNLAYADDWPERTINAIQGLVEEGKVSAERIDQSYQRIQRLKQRLSPRANATSRENCHIVGVDAAPIGAVAIVALRADAIHPDRHPTDQQKAKHGVVARSGPAAQDFLPGGQNL